MEELLRVNRAVTRLAELGFVRRSTGATGQIVRRSRRVLPQGSGRMNAATRELSRCGCVCAFRCSGSGACNLVRRTANKKLRTHHPPYFTSCVTVYSSAPLISGA